jgi:hypothetical protein
MISAGQPLHLLVDFGSAGAARRCIVPPRVCGGTMQPEAALGLEMTEPLAVLVVVDLAPRVAGREDRLGVRRPATAAPTSSPAASTPEEEAEEEKEDEQPEQRDEREEPVPVVGRLAGRCSSSTTPTRSQRRLSAPEQRKRHPSATSTAGGSAGSSTRSATSGRSASHSAPGRQREPASRRCSTRPAHAQHGRGHEHRHRHRDDKRRRLRVHRPGGGSTGVSHCRRRSCQDAVDVACCYGMTVGCVVKRPKEKPSGVEEPAVTRRPSASNVAAFH